MGLDNTGVAHMHPRGVPATAVKSNPSVHLTCSSSSNSSKCQSLPQCEGSRAAAPAGPWPAPPAEVQQKGAVSTLHLCTAAAAATGAMSTLACAQQQRQRRRRRQQQQTSSEGCCNSSSAAAPERQRKQTLPPTCKQACTSVSRRRLISGRDLHPARGNNCSAPDGWRTVQQQRATAALTAASHTTPA